MTELITSRHSKDSRFTSDGSSKELLEGLVNFLDENIDDISEIHLCIYLYNNEKLHEKLMKCAEQGIKVVVTSIPLDGYDDKNKANVYDSNGEVNYLSKHKLAKKIYTDEKPNNYELKIFDHTYVRSPKVRKFSVGVLPYSLHIKSFYIKFKNEKKPVTGILSSNLAVRDESKDELMLLVDGEDFCTSTDEFYRRIENYACEISKWKKEDDNYFYTYSQEKTAFKGGFFYTAPFYDNAQATIQEKISQIVKGAKKRIYVCAEHLAVDDNGTPGFYKDIFEKSNNQEIIVKFMSQTYVDEYGCSHGQHRPENIKNYQNLIKMVNDHPSCSYEINKYVHAKFIVVDDTIIISTANYTPTQFYYNKKISIPQFVYIPDIKYEGPFSEVSQYIILNDKGKAKQLITFFQEIENDEETFIHSPMDECQRCAIDDNTNSIVMVSAGPGSGKSTIIVEKIGALLSDGKIKAEDILILSFTNKAVEELKNRLRENLGNDARNIGVYTFHSFSRRVLNEKPTEKSWIIKEASEKLSEKDDKLNEKYYKKKILFIDEAQDLNRLMFDLVEGLKKINHSCDNDLRIMAVFDDDQAIFEYGEIEERADSSLIGTFKNFDGSKPIHYSLKYNYRAGGKLVDFTEDFREQYYSSKISMMRSPEERMKCVSGRENNGVINYVKLGELKDYKGIIDFSKDKYIQAAVVTDKVCNDLEKIINNSIILQNHTIGILVYENEQVNRIYSCLKRVCDKEWKNIVSIKRTHTSGGKNWFCVMHLDEFDYILGQITKKTECRDVRTDNSIKHDYVKKEDYNTVLENFKKKYEGSIYYKPVIDFLKKYENIEEREGKETGQSKEFYDVTELQERLCGCTFDDFVNRYVNKSIEESGARDKIVVTVSTIHKSKGLQFGSVYMLRVSKNRSDNDNCDLIRQQYVAMTRAIEYLTIFDYNCPKVENKDKKIYFENTQCIYGSGDNELDGENFNLIKEGLSEGELEMNLGDIYESFYPVNLKNGNLKGIKESFMQCEEEQSNEHFKTATNSVLQAGKEICVKEDENGVFFVKKTNGEEYWLERSAPKKEKDEYGMSAGYKKYIEWKEEMIKIGGAELQAEIYAVVIWTVTSPFENTLYQLKEVKEQKEKLEKIFPKPKKDYSWKNYKDEERLKEKDEERKKEKWVKKKIILPKIIFKGGK